MAGMGRKRGEGEGTEERGKERKAKGKERGRQRGRGAIREKKWRGEKLEQGRRLAKAGPSDTRDIISLSPLV